MKITNGMRAVAAVGLLLYVLGLLWLDRIDGRAPPHIAVALEAGVPATLYVPNQMLGPFASHDPAQQRPPAVVLMHGYTGDRSRMSGLARSLAGAGYAVLSLDLRGHGRNATPLAAGIGRPDHFEPDLAAAVSYLRAAPHVDASRVVLLGHSMGARAALAYATFSAPVDGLALIAGGWVISGPLRPRHVLFAYAEDDLPSVAPAAQRLAQVLASRGSQVSSVEIAGESHGSMIRSEPAFAEILSWLDELHRIARSEPAVYHDPRPRAALVALAGFLLLLLAGGAALGGLAPSAPRPDPSGARNLIPLAVAMLVTLPIFYARFPGVLLGASDGDRAITHLALAGLLLLGYVAHRGLLPSAGRWWASIGLAAGAVSVVYVLLNPVALGVRDVGLTPTRAGLALATALFLFPLSFSFHALLRRATGWRGAALAIAGRATIVAALAVGIAIGAFAPGERLLALASIATFALLEIAFNAYYARTQNITTAAVLESLWLGWFLAVIFPTN